jgi:hypothetical protein
MNDTIEIIKEARKAGMQTACLLFGAFLIVSLLFGYYIHKSYDEAPTNYVEAMQDNESGDNVISQGDR